MSKGRLTRRASGAALATCLVVGVLSATAASSAAQEQDPEVPRTTDSADKLGAHDLDLLAEAEAKGEPRVTIMIATEKGDTEDVQAEVEDLGGSVGKVNDKIGYVRATLPTDAVLDAAAHIDVRAVDLDELIPLPDPRPDHAKGGGSSDGRTTGPPDADTPDDNPFMPTNETGAVRFKDRNPTYDGRGVTIGIMDTGVDLDHPALQTTSTGERKIVDWFTATDPVTGLFVGGDPTWRFLTDVTGPTFTFVNITWTAPPGNWQVARLIEGSLGAASEYGGDVNRDGDTTDFFGALVDPVTQDVRVDVDLDRDFTDEPIMRPYGENFDVGHFGTDNPATPISEQVPFVVETRQDVDVTGVGLPGTLDFINFGIVAGAHGSHVAGIAAAHSLFGGDMDGAAPGAKIVSARACLFVSGCTSVALFEGMEELVVNRNVDVVNMSIGGLPALNDGVNARTILYNNLIATFGVQLVLSTGNSGPGVNTVGDPGIAADVIAAAASVSKETWKSNYGSVVDAKLNLFNFSSRGPREDGGFKPNVAAPGAAVSTVPLWQPGQPVAEAGYDLPPGYGMFNGTSMASPQTAGVVALLLSGTFDRGIPVTPAQLRQAIYSSAEPIKGVPQYGQGAGQVDINGAWSLLRRDNIEPRGYTVSAPVCTPFSQFLTDPNHGPGIFNSCAATAGGHAPGERKSYEVTITRTSGPSGNREHRLRWVGNDGTFSAPKSINLRLGVPRTFTIKARPSAGAHGALLEVDDRKTSGVDLFVMNVVEAGNALAAPSFGFTASGRVDRNSNKSFLVTVPEGAKALQVNLGGIATSSQTRWIAFNPQGVPVDNTASTACFTNFSNIAACNPFARTYSDPIPGVWEIEVESRRTSPFLENPFQIRASAQGVSVDPETTTLADVPVGEPQPLSWTLTNDFGPVAVTPAGGPLGSAFIDRPTIGHDEHSFFDVEVPAGASRLDVTIGNTSDLGADLDLFVRLNGVLVAQDADGDSEESVSVANPAAGTYEVEIHGFDVPAGTTEYDYRDVFFAGSLGSISVGGTPIQLDNGESATLSGSVTAGSTVATGRQLFGDVTLANEFDGVIGRADVVITSVIE